jgi:hypothetical protein
LIGGRARLVFTSPAGATCLGARAVAEEVGEGLSVPMRVAVAAVAATLALAGCGGGDSRLSHAQYGRALRAAIVRLDRVILVRSRARPTVRGIRTLARDVDAGADRLDALHAPRDAEQGNDELVRALRAYALDLRDFALEVQSAPGERRDAQARLARSPAVREIQRAEAELARAGYSLSSLY